MANISQLDPDTLKKLLEDAGQNNTAAMASAGDQVTPDPTDLNARIDSNKQVLGMLNSEDGSGSLPLPNGGLTTDQAIAQYGGGPVATTGFNPSANNPKEEQSQDLDDSNSTPPNDTPATSNASNLLNKLKALKENPTKNAPPLNDTLAKLLGQNNDELSDAKDQRNKLQLLALLGHAGAQAGASLTPLAHTMPDNTAFNTLMSAAQQPVTDVKNKQDLINEALKGEMLKGQAKTEIQKTDPNSSVSKAYRDLYEKTSGQKADSTMSAMDIEKLDPMLGRMFTASENAKNRAAMKESANSAKESASRDKVDQHVGDMLESSRQTPDVKQAYLDRYSASKALMLLNKYPDMNKLSNAESSLIASEVAKIAQGGVPGKEELQALKPNALPQWFADKASKLSNDPSPANAGAFLAKYKDYLNDLNANAKNVINDKVGRVIDTSEKRMNPETVKLYKEKYLKPLEDVKSKESSHPQDDEAVNWAKRNPNDPRSAQILKVNGM